MHFTGDRKRRIHQSFHLSLAVPPGDDRKQPVKIRGQRKIPEDMRGRGLDSKASVEDLTLNWKKNSLFSELKERKLTIEMLMDGGISVGKGI